VTLHSHLYGLCLECLVTVGYAFRCYEIIEVDFVCPPPPGKKTPEKSPFTS
jgi:hypothetical protein